MTSEINGTPAARTAPDTWRVRVSYSTRQGDLFETELHHFHDEPHTGDVMLILQDAIDERDLARGRHSMIPMNPINKMPTAINAEDIATIRTFVYAPGSHEPMTRLEPGYMDGDQD